MSGFLGFKSSQVKHKEVTQPKHSNPHYKRVLPGRDAYHFPIGSSHTSPCMSPYWRAKPIRLGITRDEIDRDEKPEEEE